METNFQTNPQNDPFQMVLDLLNLQFKIEMKKETQEEKEKQNDPNDEMNDRDGQEGQKEDQKGKADLIDKEEQREIENKNQLDNTMSLYYNMFQTVQEQMKNENNQIQQNQLRHKLINELMQECFSILSQPQTQQMNFQQIFFNILQSIQQKKQQLDQAQILTPPESDRNETLKQLKEICSIVDKTIEKQEDQKTSVSEQPSQNNSDANIIYTYNDQFFSNNRDFYKCQIAFNEIQNHYIRIMSQLSIWVDFCKKLPIKIDLSGQQNQKINPDQFFMSFQEKFAQTIIQQLNSGDQYKIDLTMTIWIFKWLDMIIKMCDIYLEEVQKKQANYISQENLKELQEFQKLLMENKKEFNEIQEKYNEVLPMTDEKIEKIDKIESIQNKNQEETIQNKNKNKNQVITKELLKVINQKLQDIHFYVESFEANGGEAYILKGYFFKKDEKKQKCIFRCIKTIDKDELKQMQEEYDLVRSIQQPKNIIKYFDTLSIQNALIFIVEECKNNLKNEIQKMIENNKIEEFKLFQIMFDLIEGLIEMRSYKIVHGDIKPDNILISQNGYCVFSDFGIACILEDEEESVESKGLTPSYSPPEQVQFGTMVYKSDIYSLGITIINIINHLNKITCTEQTKQIMTSFKEIAEKYMILEYYEQRLDCLQIFEKFHEIIFSQDDKSFLKIYLQKVELIIISNNFEFSQNLKDLKNFDYEYYKKVLYTYCILQIRITFLIRGVKMNNQQIEENIKNNTLDEHDIYNQQIAITILKLGDYYREQNDDQTALQFYKQSFTLQKILEIKELISHTVDKIISSFTKLSKIDECLEYLLEQNELCEIIFKNSFKSYFDTNIKQICDLNENNQS